MATYSLSTKLSRRTMLAGTTAVVSAVPLFGTVADGSHISSGAPSPTPPPRAGEGLYRAASKEEALSRLRGRVGRGCAPLDAPNDARLAVLAAEYRRVLAALDDWTGRAERQDSILAYMDPAYRARFDTLWARADGLVAEIALIRPDSIFGLAVKLRAGVYFDYAGEVALEFDQRLLAPILDDAERMAEAALFGVG